ncbi:MAG: hypothetical protein H7249_19180 [Chitinophagaceae bacterium]|nr:hypothetical protein [Oligoflexus sp.]
MNTRFILSAILLSVISPFFTMTTSAAAVTPQLTSLPSPQLYDILQAIPLNQVALTPPLPTLQKLSAFEGDALQCFETKFSGTVCVDAYSIYIDDALMVTEKEWRFKTGIGIIDNNSGAIAGALGGGLLGGGAGAMGGLIWGDKKQAQTKIDELRAQNNALQASVAQAKLDRVTDSENFKSEKKQLVASNACLRANDSFYKIAISGFDAFWGEFQQCLNAISDVDATGDVKAQACLNNYTSKVSAGINAAEVFGSCR